MTKPSTWDRETIWRRGCEAAAAYISECCILMPSTVSAASALPFPPDPVERVSDETVSVLADGRPVVMQRNAIQLMAIELIERRAKDKQVERSDPTIVYDEEELTPGPKERKS